MMKLVKTRSRRRHPCDQDQALFASASTELMPGKAPAYEHPRAEDCSVSALGGNSQHGDSTQASRIIQPCAVTVRRRPRWVFRWKSPSLCRETFMIRRWLPKIISLLFLVTLCLLSAQRASAAPGCEVSASGIAFGSYDAVGVNATAPLDGTGTITVTCGSANNTANAAISTGGSGSFIPSRRMVSGANILDYNLYTDATYSAIWGDGTGGSQMASITVDNTKQGSRTIYGRILAGLDPATGNYSDTLIVTITF